PGDGGRTSIGVIATGHGLRIGADENAAIAADDPRELSTRIGLQRSRSPDGHGAVALQASDPDIEIADLHAGGGIDSQAADASAVGRAAEGLIGSGDQLAAIYRCAAAIGVQT